MAREAKCVSLAIFLRSLLEIMLLPGVAVPPLFRRGAGDFLEQSYEIGSVIDSAEQGDLRDRFVFLSGQNFFGHLNSDLCHQSAAAAPCLSLDLAVEV